MARYSMDIDHGMGGSDVVEADDVREALALAIEWAEEGDWPNRGIAHVRVRRHDDAGNVVEQDDADVETGSDA